MLVKIVRKRSRRFLTWLVKALRITKLNPTAVTLFSMVFAFIATFFIFKHNYLISAIFVFLTGIADAFDGTLARISKRVTRFGNYIDAVIDRVSEAIIYFGFVLVGYHIEAFLAFTFGVLLSYAKARVALVKNIKNDDWISLGDRVDKFVLLMLAVLFGHFMPIIFGVSSISLFLYLLALMGFIGFVQRIVYARRLIKK